MTGGICFVDFGFHIFIIEIYKQRVKVESFLFFYYTSFSLRVQARRKRMKKGFTLIELLVVVLIIGILSSVALPQYEKAVEKSRWSEAMTNTKKLGEALEVFKLASGGALPTAISDLDVNVGTQVAGSPLSALAGKFRYTVGGSGDIVGNWEGRANTEKNYMNIVYSTNDHYLYCKLKSETTNSTAWSICKSWSNGCANRVNPAGTNCGEFICCRI